MERQRVVSTARMDYHKRAHASVQGRRSAPGPAHPILHLQQTLGNQAVQRRASACPAFPSACPTGGACHTCPARVQAKLIVSEPGDMYEQEADHVAEGVMRTPGNTSLSHHLSVLSNNTNDQTSQAGEVFSDAGFPIDAIRGGGQPLPDSLRAFFEPRFGYDFKGVRLHTDPKATESARAVNALAYTLGRDIVFGAGQYAPESSAGKHLLAHELTHVVQQQSGHASLQSSLTVDRAGDTAEREADSVANAVMEGLLAPAIRTTGFGAAIQTAGDRDPGTPPPPAPAPSPPAAGPVCGPEVTTQVTAAVAKTKTTFGGWNNAKKESQCDALDSLSTGAVAWDIVELHNNAWILGYRPACATQGATPPCGSTVKVGNDCYYAGSPNYVIYGVMCQLCNAHFTSGGNRSGADRFTEARMLYWINFYKGTGPLGISTPSANFGPSRDWAVAGYRGWPGASAPAGDRNTCAPTCPTAYSGGAFNVNWVPHGVL